MQYKPKYLRKDEDETSRFLSSLDLKNIHCIIEPGRLMGGLYLGDYQGARDMAALNEYKIKSVLTCGSLLTLDYKKDGFKHMIIEAADSENYDMKKHFELAFEFIDKNRKNGSVYVHCFAGVSRSATIVIAYIMKRMGKSYEEARKFVKSKRSLISPNFGFVKQLREFDAELQKGKFQPKLSLK